jgi:hypothetical protein
VPLPLTLRFNSNIGVDVPAATDGYTEPWNAQFVRQMRPPRITQHLYYQSEDQSFTEPYLFHQEFWPTKTVKVQKPPAFVSLYYRNASERVTDAPDANQQAPALSWRAPVTYKRNYPAALFQIIQQYDATGEDATGVGSQEASWVPRPFKAWKPFTGYLFNQNVTPDDQAVQRAPETYWRRPHTFTPAWPITITFPGIKGDDTPEAPAESAFGRAWTPRPLRIERINPAWRLAFWSPNTDRIDEPTSQFMVLWRYQTNYERTVRQFFNHILQGEATDGVSIPEPATFEGFTNRLIKVNEVPKLARLLYQQNTAQDFSIPPEPPTPHGWTPKPLWPFMAPKGAYMYYRSGHGKDEPAPLPTPSTVGRNTVLYMRRLELLGVRLGMTSVG